MSCTIVSWKSPAWGVFRAEKPVVCCLSWGKDTTVVGIAGKSLKHDGSLKTFYLSFLLLTCQFFQLTIKKQHHQSKLLVNLQHERKDPVIHQTLGGGFSSPVCTLPRWPTNWDFLTSPSVHQSHGQSCKLIPFCMHPPDRIPFWLLLLCVCFFCCLFFKWQAKWRQANRSTHISLYLFVEPFSSLSFVF